MSEAAAILITQVSDPTGASAPAQFRRLIEGTLNFSRSASAIDFLVRLGAQRGDTAGEFRYSDPQRGSGSARLDGFTPDEIRRIDDYFRIEEMRIRLDLAPSARQPLEPRTYWTRPATTQNPIPMIVIGGALALLALALGLASSVGPLRVPGEAVTWAYVPLFGALALGAIVLIVLQARRLPAWLALRRAFHDAGEPLPRGLRGTD